MAITATCMSAAIPDVLHRLRHAECDDQAAFDVILIEKRRRDRDLTGADELFDQADELDQQVFLATPNPFSFGRKHRRASSLCGECR